MAKQMNSTETEAKKWVEAFIHKTIEHRESSMGSIVFKFLPSRRIRICWGMTKKFSLIR